MFHGLLLSDTFFAHACLCITFCPIFLVDSNKTGTGAVPESFPGSILLQRIEGKLSLHPLYRNYGGNKNEVFDYFARQILLVSNPSFNRYNERCGNELISEIYTVPDEAFGLLIIYNECHVWQKQVEQKKRKEKVTRNRKRFCDGKSGNRQGWTSEGITLFHSLCIQVRDRRKETKEEEVLIRKKFADARIAVENSNTTTGTGTASSNTDEAHGDSSIAEDEYYIVDENIRDLFSSTDSSDEEE